MSTRFVALFDTRTCGMFFDFGFQFKLITIESTKLTNPNGYRAAHPRWDRAGREVDVTASVA